MLEGRADYITYTWNKVQYADQYSVQASTDQTFATVTKRTTTSDTSKYMGGHVQGTVYYWRVQAISFAGPGEWSDVWSFKADVLGVKEEMGTPTAYSISQNYPNPFNPTTTISFALPQSGFTTLTVYDILGREVHMLLNKKVEAGIHEINFDATNFQSGVYFYKIQSGNFSQIKKMVFMK
ncbi:MAG: T9SS C-terminal target domain-containing protein [Ignavibacteriae bacterium]|nr:MAG: T9SS C-terminal target domain-containing protein [Ignavibacteriota bacterium]